MKKTIYKTVIQIELLSEYPIDSSSDMSALINEAETGDLSMRTIDKVSNKPIKGKKAIEALAEHGTDLAFFMMDENGNELED